MIEFLNFSDIVEIARLQLMRSAAGCPSECEDTPWNCDRDTEYMPEDCFDELNEFLIAEKLQAKYTDECGRPIP